MIQLLQIVTSPLTAWSLLGEQLSFMSQHGFEVLVISGPGELLEKAAKKNNVDWKSVSFERQPNPIKDAKALLELLHAIHQEKPEVVNYSTPKAGLLGGIASLLMGVPLRVYVLRGLRAEGHVGWKFQVLKFLEKVSCSTAHQVICVSESLKERVLELGLASEDKLVVLAHGSSKGVDSKRFDQEAVDHEAVNAFREKHQVPTDKTIVGFVGRIVQDKGIVELVDAFEQSNREDAVLLLVGPYEKGNRISEDMRSRIEANPHIIHVDMIEDTVPAYSAMDMLVLPSYREGFPNVPLEAAGMSLPVVTTDATGCRDSVVDGETGFIVKTRDAEELKIAIERYLDDPELAKEHGRNGRERVVEKFQSLPIWEELLKLYQEGLEKAKKKPSLRSRLRNKVKRLFDVSASASAIALLSPVMLGAFALVRHQLGSPILFKQQRPGQDGKPFTMYKLRTMRDAKDGPIDVSKDAERLTPLGEKLRALSIDELPTLINVLKGDMSIVGPRPLLMQYLERYSPEQAKRHDVKPGITGWAQINGRNALSWEEKFEHDVWYVENQSLLLDLKILVKTVLKVLQRDGISHEGQATMHEFMGTEKT